MAKCRIALTSENSLYMERVSVNDTEILTDIYKEVFLKDSDRSINVFLCGSNPNTQDSIRGLVYEALRNDAAVNIVFPEWLFSDLLVKSQYNLLELENDLAKNVDIVVLPLEGIGTIAELGSFASYGFGEIRKKIVVINHANYRNSQSFINVGPIKLIREVSKHNIIYYDDKGDVSAKIVSHIKYLRERVVKYDVNNLFGLSKFILFVIGIFQPINKEKLRQMLIEWDSSLHPHYIEPCLKILVKKERILSQMKGYDEHFKLTEEGHRYVFENMLPHLGVVKVFGRIRTEAINTMNKRRWIINLEKEREKLLDVS